MTVLPGKGLSWAVNQFEIELIVDYDLPKKHLDLNHHETFKIERILETLGSYLRKLSDCAKNILTHNTNLDWYFNNRKIIFQLITLLKKIDAYLTLIFDLRLTLSGSFTLEEIALLSMDSMQLISSIKKRSDVATSYMELRHLIIDTLDIELSDCSTEMFSIKNTFKQPYINEKLTIELVLEKFRFDGLRKVSSPCLSAVSLPSLYDAEEQSFDRLDQLEKRLDPMQASIEFLAHKISEFDSLNASLFQDANDFLASDFRNLQNRWDALLVNFAALKRNSIDSRYYKIFYFMITEVLSRVHKLIRDVKNEGIIGVSEKIAGDFKVCSSTIKLINLAFKDSLIYQKDLLSLYNESVLPRWSYLNVLLGEEKPPSPSVALTVSIEPGRDLNSSPNQISALSFPLAGIDEIMAISTLNTDLNIAVTTHAKPKDDTSRNPSGGSLNLGLGISPSTTVPYSVSKRDRILDLNIDAQEIPKSNIQMALMGLSETSGVEQKVCTKNGETATIMGMTPRTKVMSKNVLNESSVPNLSPVERASRKSALFSPSVELPLISEKKTTRQLLEILKKDGYCNSRIPQIVPDYGSFQLPKIKKMAGKTKIPSIAPDNPVFYSPERRADIKTPHRNISSSCCCDLPSVLEDTPENYQEGLDTEDFSLIQTPEDKQLLSPWVDKRQLSSFTSSTHKSLLRTPPLNLLSRKPSLNSVQVPHLSPSDKENLFLSPKWRSTSPERPGSSMGSRYDEVNLTQPLKSLKQRWK